VVPVVFNVKNFDLLHLDRWNAEFRKKDVENRDDWRATSVFDGLVAAKISGKGREGYREGLEVLAKELEL
jgi:3-dehydroquinate dehydratase